MNVLKVTYEVLTSLLIKIMFEDGSIKKNTIELGDYISVVFNKDGCRKTVDGYVTRIYMEPHRPNCGCHRDIWYFIVDASQVGGSQVEKINVETVLDLDILRRKADTQYVETPNSTERVMGMKIIGNTVYVTQDGTNWLKMIDLPKEDPVVDPDDQDLYTKVDAIVPNDLRADVQTRLISDIIKLVKEETKEAVDDPIDK